jgi:outer membrane protein OmpA-like peptidoglycan-associated protein
MRTLRFMLAVALMALLGCATQGTSVVLLEDGDGGVGRVAVKSEAGSQALESARQETHVKSPGSRPSAPRILNPQEITRQYGPTLAALPQPPEIFRLYFETGTTTLTTESVPDIDRIVAAIQRRKSVDVRISGHSDRVGSEEYNLRLSLERAEAVRDRLVRVGVDPVTIQVSSHGYGLPLVPTAYQVPEPRNRRVEVTVR